MDSQQVEIIGRNWLVSELYRSGLEVARPERDHGIDLIAYLDLDQSAISLDSAPAEGGAPPVVRRLGKASEISRFVTGVCVESRRFERGSLLLPDIS